MANSEEPSFDFSLNSHDTALAILAREDHWPTLNRIRSLYDAASHKWPPHINLLYPFCPPSSLTAASQILSSILSTRQSTPNPFGISLTQPGHFPRRNESVCFLTTPYHEQIQHLKDLVHDLQQGFEERGVEVKNKRPFAMHLTMGQAAGEVNGKEWENLMGKLELMPEMHFRVEDSVLVILKREDGKMRLWGTVDVHTGELNILESTKGFDQQFLGEAQEEKGYRDALMSGKTVYWDEEMRIWGVAQDDDYDLDDEGTGRQSLTVASYNVLAEFDYPQKEDRYPLLVRNILSDNAEADVLVLQEVTDGFLSFLLGDDGVRDRFPYCSHGPPSQPDMEPLPNFLNMVVLSKIAFDWESVSFQRKHKGALVAKFRHVGKWQGDEFKPVVLASVHLSHGLTDGAVTSKKGDIKRLIGYLEENYEGCPWVLAGDFNITTSQEAVQAALEKKNISDLTAEQLRGLDTIFRDANLVDAWEVTTDDKESGATWDPTINGVAVALSGGNVWPQRYDRILARGEGFLEVKDFNMFGLEKGQVGDVGEESFASDHWGIRSVLGIGEFGFDQPEKAQEETQEPANSLVVPVHLERAPKTLSGTDSIKACLSDLGVIPDEEEAAKRKDAFELLKATLLDATTNNPAAARLQSAVVIVPVGSYALGVWTTSSDIDVCCIGPFSSNTFFSMASSCLRKAATQGIRILRRVKANTGTMLELDVQGIRMDLQYCPAASVADQWPNVLRLPAKDPVWSLAPQTLNKLKAIRDIDYLRRSLPDLAAFRLAHRFIKTWAKSRGIYSARFGYLSGIQIAILLARVQKLLAKSNPSVEDLITSFFTHYSTFDFATSLIFDPTFHSSTPQYTRSYREPLAILGYFPPALNTASAATLPSVHTLSKEFALAASSLATSPSWSSFLSPPTTTFLTQFKTYIKLDLSYWGLSLQKGAQFLGWFESRCALLLVDISRKCPGLHARMWPARFVESSDLTSESENDYRGCYLIGLDKTNPSTPKAELQSALGALQTVLPRFEDQIRNDGKYFDSRNRWMSASLINQSSLPSLVLDTREWGESNPGEEESESDTDTDNDEEELEEEEFSEEAYEAAKRRRKAAKQAKKEGKGRKQHVVVVREGRFRTALDVMNRIKWDAAMDSGDFVVGYEDRFLGAQEKELEEWRTEQTDEEFIPQHRILYFRRRSDDRVVWDRRRRVDEVFGGERG
ncbi:hypothetical protein QBC40DRAFT_312312 [Triangularia verruculosa]|uniref:polynucleotide adenylyltransferase n=1 Tax=Triangularia verruculosa TaxID=2587418 RepID=A0AAN7AYZ9_9PEZI|nr:hypothetical protein QBC40DRAFT_312312 [Triangularia verruculosa]